HAVIVNLLRTAFQVESIHLVAGNLHFPRLAQDLREQVQSPRQPSCPEIHQPVHQVEMTAAETVSAALEVVAAAETVTEGRQFQERQVESAAVEGDELEPFLILVLVGRQTAPEGFDNLPRPKGGGVQLG